MDLEMFQQVVFVLCTKFNPQEKFPASSLRESQELCIEHYINCAVKDGGNILPLDKFEKECVK